MGYYYFHNISRNESNQHAIPGRGNQNCILQLYKYDNNAIKKIFQLIIMINKNWGRGDEISAASASEDNAIIIYFNDVLSFHEVFEERETNLPFDDMDIEEPYDAADNDE